MHRTDCRCFCFRWGTFGLAAAIAELWFTSAAAQAQLELLPDRNPASDLQTQVVPGAQPNQRLIQGGTRPGAAPGQPGPNLFHSFEAFNVPLGQAVYFEAVPGVENILGRVVGSDPSDLLGTVGILNSNANLFLLNPNGIVLGNDLELDLSGAFFAAAADGFTFDGGLQFSAVQLSDAPPLLNVQLQPGLQLGAVPQSITAGNLSKQGGPLTLAASGNVVLDRISGG